jgi:hypothetical protein
MKVGVNYPWKNYGWDFGIGPWGPRRAWREGLVAELRALQKLGVHAVRWFILGDGLTYGTGPDAPHEDPTRLWKGHAQWRFNPPTGAAVKPILDDFEALLACVREANEGATTPLRLMPAVIDFHMFFPGNYETGPFASKVGTPPPEGFVKCGRMDLIIDERKTKRYLDHLLAGLVEVARAAPYRDLIHAFDLFNEPEWCTNDGRSSEKRTIPLARMGRFLRECADVVRPHFTTTVGFAEAETLFKWNVRALDLGLWQYHYYAKPAEIPVWRDAMPCVIGEFATTDGRPATAPSLWQSLTGASVAGDRTWPELGGPEGDQRVSVRLSLLEKKGYCEAYVWSCHAQDRSTQWDDTVRDEIARFVAGKK